MNISYIEKYLIWKTHLFDTVVRSIQQHTHKCMYWFRLCKFHRASMDCWNMCSYLSTWISDKHCYNGWKGYYVPIVTDKENNPITVITGPGGIRDFEVNNEGNIISSHLFTMIRAWRLIQIVVCVKTSIYLLSVRIQYRISLTLLWLFY